MSLTLHFHPLASFCWKVLIALYENDTPFEPVIVDLGEERSRAAFLKLWPMGKMPVLVDAARDRTVPESTIIVDYLAAHYPGASELVPADPELARQTRLADRFYDFYVHEPMQKIVVDTLRPAGRNDPFGVEQARATLATAYGMIDDDMRSKNWATGRRLHARRLRGLSGTLLRQQGGAIPEPVSQPRRAISSGWRGVRRCCA